MRVAVLCVLALVAAGRRNPAEAGARVAHFGGSGPTRAQAIAADSQGNSYIAGSTRASDFPGGGCLAASGVERLFVAKFSPAGDMLSAVCVRGAFQTASPGECARTDRHSRNTLFPPGTEQHPFVLKLSPEGRVVYGTLVTGSCGGFGQAVAVNGDGQAISGALDIARMYSMSSVA